MGEETFLIDREDLPKGYASICPLGIKKCFAPQYKDLYEFLCSNNKRSCANFLKNEPISDTDFDLEHGYEIATRVVDKRRVLALVKRIESREDEVAN